MTAGRVAICAAALLWAFPLRAEEPLATPLEIADRQVRLGDLAAARKTLFEYLRDHPDDPGAAEAFSRFTAIENQLDEAEAARIAKQKEAVKAAAVAAAVQISLRPPEPPRLPARRWTWIAAGAASLSAAGGVLYGTRAQSAARDLRSAPHDRPLIDQRRAVTLGDAHRATGLFVAAGLLGAATAALYVVRW